MKLSYIFPCRHNSDPMRLCLDSLEAHSKITDRELIFLLDVYPSWQTMSLLKRRGLKWIDTPYCNWYQTLNYGASIAKGEYLVLCETDVVFAPDWDVNIMKHIDHRKMMSPVWVEWHNTGNWFGAEPDEDDIKYTKDFRMNDFIDWCKAHSQDGIKKGTCSHPIVISKELFDKCGGLTYFTWDEGGHIHHEDGLKHRVIGSGGQVSVALDSFIYHFGGANTDKNDYRGWKFYIGKSLKMLVCRKCGIQKDALELYPEVNPESKRMYIDPIMKRGWWECGKC